MKTVEAFIKFPMVSKRYIYALVVHGRYVLFVIFCLIHIDKMKKVKIKVRFHSAKILSLNISGQGIPVSS
jgi:hypothetical protein